MTVPGRPHVTILGMQASGKTTLGALVAQRAGLPHLDSDDVLADDAGTTAARLARDEGVDGLHRREAAIARELLAGSEPAVVTPAASILDDPDTLAVVGARSWLVVLLDATPEQLLGRYRPRDHRRAMDESELAARWAARRPRAVAVADLVLDATQPPEVLAERIGAVRSC